MSDGTIAALATAYAAHLVLVGYGLDTLRRFRRLLDRGERLASREVWRRAAAAHVRDHEKFASQIRDHEKIMGGERPANASPRGAASPPPFPDLERVE